MSKRLGLMGGTFNPVHNGHLYIAGLAQRELGLEEVRFIPTGDSPHKRVDMPGTHRLRMVELAIEGRAGFTVSDMEMKRAGRSYTCDTLREIQEREPDAELYFILGGDMFCDITTWRRPDEIARRAVLAVVHRPGDPVGSLEQTCLRLERDYGARVRLLSGSGPEISSTQIRRLIGAGQDADALLPPPVARYIREKRLYLKQESGI